MKFIVCIANGSEELESISIIDTLRRTKAMEVIVAKIFEQKETDHTDLKIKASRDCWLVADTVFTKELLMDENVIGIALPGFFDIFFTKSSKDFKNLIIKQVDWEEPKHLQLQICWLIQLNLKFNM